MKARALCAFSALILTAGAVLDCGSGNGSGPSDGGSVSGDDGSTGPGGGGKDGGAGGTDGGGGAPDAGPDAPMIPPGPTDFFSSFETGDPQPTWSDTVETDAKGQPKASGVTGQSSASIPGNVMGQVMAITASAENPPNEVAANVGDGDLTTKWLAFAATGWVQVQLTKAIAVVSYAVSAANDAPERDPKAWTLDGSQDGKTWTTVDSQTNQSFASRFQTNKYAFTNTTAYAYYRLNITQNNGGPDLQMSELQLSDGSGTTSGPSPMKSDIGNGPASSYNAKANAGFSGLHALRYGGTVTATGRGYSYNKIFDVDLVVHPTSELSYLVFPSLEPNDTTYASTFAAVDLAFDDGTYLSDLNAPDQSFAAVNPSGQGASRTLYPNEWNYKVSEIGTVAAGKRIKRILVGYDNPAGPVPAFGGWIDDLRIVGNPARPPVTHLSDYALTTRGTNSSGSYSRGNNFPATAVPHGFNFWTPTTDATSDSWLYTYHQANNANNLPVLQALSLSHEPSPWMGDRQSFQVMPAAATGTPTATPAARGLPFQHANETARPYYYGVTFENGIKAEIAPTDHAAIFQFTFTGSDANLIFDNAVGAGGLTLDAGNKAISGYTDAKSGLSAGATRLFVYATFDKPVTASGMLSGGGGAGVTGYFRFDVSSGKTVTMRIATSLISVAQAQKNLALEIAATDTFDTVKAAAQKLWDDKFGIVQVEGANLDQLTTLYSNLYRLFLYPNSAFENTGTAQSPTYQYASPFAPATGANTSTQTGAAVLNGKVYVNNGFWDTYRGCWAAFSLFTPTEAAALIDGFVQQYRDGGWVARWSSPGYANLMTGTSSDVAFADAYVKGVTGFDAPSAYDAALKTATVPSGDSAIGRNGLTTSIFKGYTPTSTGAGYSWAMAGYLNDFGLSGFASALAAANASDPRHQQYLDEAEYFRDRSQNFVNLFDPSVKFFQGKGDNGAFAQAAGSYDPRVWGNDYTETDGWNMAFDPTYDGQGLANLDGGNAQLGAKLDTFFSTPETAGFPGGYGGIIHEMLEAHDVRMGQLGLSNEPSFHIPYMYLFAGEPSKTQAKVRDALNRLWAGSAIGQGYLGDEDNGAMSTWQVWSALGIYPLQVGSATYVVGSPLFTKATITLENGKSIVINAPNNSPQNVYVQGLKVNGQPYAQTYLPHSLLAAGATLDFDMGPAPSSWGTAASDAPPSLTTGASAPTPLLDAASPGNGSETSSDGTNVAALFDDSSATQVTFSSQTPNVQFHANSGSPAVAFYTITSSNTSNDPTSFTLSGSNDGSNWTQLDSRSGQTFKWRNQTRAFKVPSPGAYAYYQLALTGGSGLAVSEIEFLTKN